MPWSLPISAPPLAWLIELEYLSAWQAALLFGLLAAPIVALGVRSLGAMGPARKWVAIGVRLVLVLVLVLLLAGLQWKRQDKDLQVIILRDISDSVELLCKDAQGKPLREPLDGYVRKVAATNKPPMDQVGVVTFNNVALIDALPNTTLALGPRSLRDPGGTTDLAAGINLGLASFQRGFLRRLMLISDGNQTGGGNWRTAVAAAKAQGVPIDVMPLSYRVTNEVLVDRLVSSKTWRREGETFTLDVVLKNTNTRPVTGRMVVYQGPRPLVEKQVTLEAAESPDRPKLHVEQVEIRELKGAGVHQFRATFDVPREQNADTMPGNNAAGNVVIVEGKGRALLVDDVDQSGAAARYLVDAMKLKGIDVVRVPVDAMPQSVVEFENYDAVILANVSRASVLPEQDRALAAYVHDLGGGLIMLGGPKSFGAGGWQNSKVEQVLPVNMELPAQRQMPKGALVLVMHSCEMPRGNHWGTQCAIKAIETLSARDEIGIVLYTGVAAGGIGGAGWELPLQEKGGGDRAIAVAHRMRMGDMPSFDSCIQLALHGATPTQYSLRKSDAAQKHIIVISDGDPTPPTPQTFRQCREMKVTISTVSVYPHNPDPQGVPPTMRLMADETGGRWYPQIEKNPGQLPQIFIKEAITVRRSLIDENPEGIPVAMVPTASELTKGFSGADFARLPVTGLVLTSKKPAAQVELPLVAGKNADPLLAFWQSGLGKAAAFTSDAHNAWARQWVESEHFGKFWAQVIQAVQRPANSNEFDVQITRMGEKARVTVEALRRDSRFLNFLTVRGAIIGPDGPSKGLRLVQTGPGTYVGEFDTPLPGNYVVSLNYTGGKDEKGRPVGGMARAVTVVSDSPELRDLRSNERVLKEIALQTGGRMLSPFDWESAALFSREGIRPTASPLPVWDILLPIAIALLLVDVAVRRIAWDWLAIRRAAASAAHRVREWTLSRKVESRQTLDALKRAREQAQAQMRTDEPGLPPATLPAPDRTTKFEAAGVEGDITQVVGGATDKPLPAAPAKSEPKGADPEAGSHTSSLMAAKRRARQVIKDKQQGEQ